MTLNTHKPLLYAIDAHHHYWWHGKRHHQWPAGVGNRLNQSFTPNDLILDMEAAKVNGCILMQSLNDYDETIEFLQIAAQHSHVLGVVGWLPLDNQAQTLKHLENLPNRELLIGVRHLINFEPDPKWLLRPEVIDSIYVIEDQRLVFDVVPVNEVQFDSVLAVANRFPNLLIVLDHLARPPIDKRDPVSWHKKIQMAAQLPNVSIKLSLGLDILMDWKWSIQDIQEFADKTIHLFGVDRVMAASNWPVCNLAANYSELWSGVRALIKDHQLIDQTKILSENAKKIFSFNKLPIVNSI